MQNNEELKQIIVEPVALADNINELTKHWGVTICDLIPIAEEGKPYVIILYHDTEGN